MVKIFKGIPYTGTLPAVLTGTKAGYLHRYKIYGSLTQNGTPTPSDPIYPTECGERTENYYNYVGDTPALGYYVNPSDGSLTQAAGWAATDYISIDSDAVILSKVGGTTPGICLYDNAKQYLNGVAYNTSGAGSVKNVTISANGAKYARFSYNLLRVDTSTLTLVAGSTAPTSYIPYGYKLHLLSGSTPVDIYLGESQTTRRIKKLVLDGTENWQKSSTYGGSFLLRNAMNDSTLAASPLSNLLLYAEQASYTSGSFTITGTAKTLNVWFPQFDAQTTTESFKAYLAEQYTAGTPVTIWYVLAEPETGTLNEPLRKIGNYADTIDSTQTTAQIPTTANSTTISWAGQGLAPSEFDSIAEWVSATPKIYTNGAWTDAQTYTYDDGAWVADN